MRYLFTKNLLARPSRIFLSGRKSSGMEPRYERVDPPVEPGTPIIMGRPSRVPATTEPILSVNYVDRGRDALFNY